MIFALNILRKKMHPTSHNGGFTLIELLIVIAMIAVLAAYSSASYSEFVIRTKITSAITLVSQCKNIILENLMLSEYKETNNWGCELNPLGNAAQDSGYVRSIQVDNHGVITLTLTGFNRPDIDNKVINFAPINHKKQEVTRLTMDTMGPVSNFDCRTPPISASGIAVNFLPRPCHGF